MDLRKGYFHIQLAELSRDLMTMITHQGLFRYKRLPMGLTESGAIFQWLVSQMLAGCKGVILYFDSILIYGENQEEHDLNLDAALARLADKNFHLQLAKCQFGINSVHFLGHIISSDGNLPDQENVKPILDATTPYTLSQVESFLHIVGFYSDFLPILPMRT